MFNNIIDKAILKLSTYTPKRFVAYATIFVLLSSIPLVYLICYLFHVQYTAFLLIISMALPLIITPVVITIIIRLTMHLKYSKEHLDKEIEKNRKKDVILFEQARFALMGEMIANISHQWKQPLNTINLAVLNTRVSELNRENLDKNFDIIEDNVNYLASTIDDFMSFFDKKKHHELRTIPSIIKEVKSIIQAQILSQKIRLNIEVDESYAGVEIASSISQVILNLLNNAKDAFEDKVIDKEINIKLVTTQDGLEILCCDNGMGIKEDIKDKIFNPYFTTKSKTQGTGIGLYMSKQIVQKIFDGNISLNDGKKLSQDDKTCFIVKVPYSKTLKLLDYKVAQ